MERMDQESHECLTAGMKFFAAKMWALNSSGPFLAAHIKTIMEYSPRQVADSLSVKKVLDATMKKLEAQRATH